MRDVARRRFKTGASETSTTVPQIEVRTGSDVSVVALPAGRYEIGGSPNCDLVVPGCRDEVVCVLDLYDRTPFVYVMGVASGSTLAGKPVNTDSRHPLSRDVAFVCGDLAVRALHAPPSEIRQPTTWRRLGLRQTAAIVVGLAGAVTLAYAGAGLDTAGTVKPREPRPAIVALPTPESVLTAMRSRMGEIGLTPTPDVKAEIDRVVVDLPNDGKRRDIVMAVIAEMRKRSAIPIVTRAAIDERMLGLIAGASLFPRKLVIGRNGQAYAEGDLIGGEWRVKEIRSDRVTLDRGQEQVSVALGDTQ